MSDTVHQSQQYVPFSQAYSPLEARTATRLQRSWYDAPVARMIYVGSLPDTMHVTLKASGAQHLVYACIYCSFDWVQPRHPLVQHIDRGKEWSSVSKLVVGSVLEVKAILLPRRDAKDVSQMEQE